MNIRAIFRYKTLINITVIDNSKQKQSYNNRTTIIDTRRSTSQDTPSDKYANHA